MATPAEIADRLHKLTLSILRLLRQRNADPADAMLALTRVYLIIYRTRPSATRVDAQKEMSTAIEELWAIMGPVEQEKGN